MSKLSTKKSADIGRFYWVLELAVFATVTPAVIYGLMSLNNLPIIA